VQQVVALVEFGIVPLLGALADQVVAEVTLLIIDLEYQAAPALQAKDSQAVQEFDLTTTVRTHTTVVVVVALADPA
jgi:hypothetical protein